MVVKRGVLRAEPYFLCIFQNEKFQVFTNVAYGFIMDAEMFGFETTWYQKIVFFDKND